MNQAIALRYERPHAPGLRLLAALAKRWHNRRRTRADHGLLMAMDERDLRDLGMGRGQVDYWLRAPLD